MKTVEMTVTSIGRVAGRINSMEVRCPCGTSFPTDEYGKNCRWVPEKHAYQAHCYGCEAVAENVIYEWER